MLPTTTVTIAGLTGSLAQLIAKHLLALPDQSVKIHGLCRSPSKLPETLRKDSRVTIFASTADDNAAIRSALNSSDVAICCYLGGNDFMTSAQRKLIDACIAEGVPRYIAGDWSMDFRKLTLGEHPAKDPMKHTAAYLDEKKDQIKAVHVLNACFLEAPWRGMWDPKNFRLNYWSTGDERWELTSYDDAAAFTARIAVDLDASGWFSFRGDHRNVHEMASDFTSAYGKEPSVHCLGSLEDLYNIMHETRDNQPENVWAWLPLFYTYYSINGQTTLPLPLDNDKYPGAKCMTVKDYFEKTPLEKLGRT